MQCKMLNVWSVCFFFNTLSCQNYFFQGVWGAVYNSGNSGGVWGGYFSGQKLEIPGRRGGLREIPSVVGIWIFSGTTHLDFPNATHLNFEKINCTLTSLEFN